MFLLKCEDALDRIQLPTRWFHEDVMRFDSMEYRRRFWREAYRNAHTIGDMPRTWIEFTDPRRRCP